jgi:hypothetical protein
MLNSTPEILAGVRRHLARMRRERKPFLLDKVVMQMTVVEREIARAMRSAPGAGGRVWREPGSLTAFLTRRDCLLIQGVTELWS